MALITLAALGLGGVALGALGSAALTPKTGGTGAMGVSLLGTGVSKKETYAPISTYAPQVTTTYAPAQTYAYAPQVSYAPQVQIASPQAQQVSKKEFTSQLEQAATARPVVTPSQEFPISVAPETGITDYVTPILLIGAVAAGAYILTRKKKRRK